MVADFNIKENRKVFNKRLLFQVLGIFFILCAFSLIVADVRLYSEKEKLNSRINIYQKQIDDIKKSNQTSESEIANSDSIDYLERLAYEQFNQMRPGETGYIFVKSQDKTETALNKQNVVPWLARISNAWKSVWYWIKNKF